MDIDRILYDLCYGDLSPNATTSQNTASAAVTIESVMAAADLFKSKVDDYRRKRDDGFSRMRRDGLMVWAWDGTGWGETWVISDAHYHSLIRSLKADDTPWRPAGCHFGDVRVLALSDAVSLGFTPPAIT